jgi:broad specificity phosphatase PhoE
MDDRYQIELFDPCTLKRLATFHSSDLNRARQTALNAAAEGGMHSRVTDLMFSDVYWRYIPTTKY